MIRQKLKGVLGHEISDDELRFLLDGIKQDILRNRLYSNKPKRTTIRYIIRLGLILHSIWERSQNNFLNGQECGNFSEYGQEHSKSDNSIPEKFRREFAKIEG